MKKSITLSLFASLVLASFVSVNAQETASALPVKASVNDAAAASAPERQLTDIYRVGVGDVLDIRLNLTSNRSTLFTVIEEGVIDIPLAGGVISVVGRTPEEIQNVISAELKRRAVDENAKVSVGVRQYLSHSITVSGLVNMPGIRFLRRERVPLYVVLSESQLRNDGGRVVILRAGVPGPALDLSDTATLNLTVQAGDVITAAGGTPVTDTESLAAVLAKSKPGDTVSVQVSRVGTTSTAQVTLGQLAGG